MRASRTKLQSDPPRVEDNAGTVQIQPVGSTAPVVILCDGCDSVIPPFAAKDLLDGRWKCAQCPDFDLCGRCFGTHAHRFEHCFLHITLPAPSSVFGTFLEPSMLEVALRSSRCFKQPPRYICDGCDEPIPDGAVRAVCTFCTDFDLCERCYVCNHVTRKAHDVTHVFLRLPASDEGHCLSIKSFGLGATRLPPEMLSRLSSPLAPAPSSSSSPLFPPPAVHTAQAGVDLSLPLQRNGALIESEDIDNACEDEEISAAAAASATGSGRYNTRRGAKKERVRAVIARCALSDLRRVTEVEAASFGREGWSIRAMTSLTKPDKNRFLDVAWIPSSVLPDQIGHTLAGYVAYDFDDVLSSAPSQRCAADELVVVVSRRRCCDIVSIAVDPAFRGMGLGALLLEHVISTARFRCASVVKLHVRVHNLTAQALYTSRGFKIRERIANYYSGTKVAANCPPDENDAFLLELSLA